MRCSRECCRPWSRGGPELSEVHRTKLAWEQEAWQQLRRGEVDVALQTYAQRGRLRVSATRGDAFKAATEAWNDDGRTGVIVADTSNAERDAANLRAQRYKAAAGELGAESVRLSSTALALHAGDSVIFSG